MLYELICSIKGLLRMRQRTYGANYVSLPLIVLLHAANELFLLGHPALDAVAQDEALHLGIALPVKIVCEPAGSASPAATVEAFEPSARSCYYLKVAVREPSTHRSTKLLGELQQR